MATASKVLSIAAGEVGYSRWTDPQTGTKYGRWYAEKTKSSYFGQNGVPYCAMFVAWVLNQAGQSCPGMPTASCGTALSGARKAGIVRSNRKSAQPGDLVIFDWSGKATATNHIGFVEKNCGSYLQTIEGNTSKGTGGSQGNGGHVARRTRDWKYVTAVIAVPYNDQSLPVASEKLEVDGEIGKKSTMKWQSDLGTAADGVISGQYSGNKKYLPRLYSVTWNNTGSPFVKALQKFLNAHGNYGLAIDGHFGPNTIIALQKFLRDRCRYKKHAIGGILDANTAANVQNALNAGYFKK